jgi:hypothetical protein
MKQPIYETMCVIKLRSFESSGMPQVGKWNLPNCNLSINHASVLRSRDKNSQPIVTTHLQEAVLKACLRSLLEDGLFMLEVFERGYPLVWWSPGVFTDQVIKIWCFP